MSSLEPHIAIIDDDESVRKSLKRLLLGSGFGAETYASGIEFLVSLQTRTPDALMLDIFMPGLNGLEVQTRLLATGRQIPVLFISAHDDATLRAKAFAGGAAAYLDKPVCREVLLSSLHKALGAAIPLHNSGSGV